MGPRTILYGDAEIPFQLTRRNELEGKVRIRVDHDGSIIVVAPATASMAQIRAAVRQRARWLSGHLEKTRGRKQDLLPRQYISGESHFYLGKRYQLKVIPLEQPYSRACGQKVKLLRGQLQVTTANNDALIVKKLLKGWYRDHAKIRFENRIEELIKRAPWVKEVPPLKLLTMKKHWGSCSPSGNILLNPHLVKAPSNCIDYVILHELCHLKEHNHSKKFWRLMDRVCPEWKEPKAQLDNLAEVLLNE